MRYFLDTEFIERGHEYPIDLISIGIVAQDGRWYYAVNKQCQFQNASPWVWKNVLDPMGITIESGGTIDANAETLFCLKNRQRIKEELLLFFAGGVTNPVVDQSLNEESYKTVEVWADYASYDWVVFCQIFDTMMDLPSGFPMHINDIQQEARRLGNPVLPEQKGIKHHALYDARYDKELWEFLQNLG